MHISIKKTIKNLNKHTWKFSEHETVLEHCPQFYKIEFKLPKLTSFTIKLTNWITSIVSSSKPIVVLKTDRNYAYPPLYSP